MSKQQVTKAIEKALGSSRIGILSTARHSKPNSRYMILYNDDLNLYTRTNINSLKIEEIENSPDAHILLGYNETTSGSFVETDVIIEIVENQKIIDWLRETQDKTFFNSKEDPELCVFRVIPRSIKLMNSDELDAPATIEL